MKQICIILISLVFAITALPAQDKSDEYLEKAIEQEKKGNIEIAMGYLTTAIRYNTKNDEAYEERGDLYLVLDKYNEAIKDYESALNLSPSSVRYFKLGVVHHDLGHNERALFYFNKAIEFNHDNYKYYYFRALTHLLMGNDTQAILDFNRAINMHEDGLEHPEDDNLYFNRGLAHMHLHHYKLALEDFDMCIKLKPTVAEYYFERGEAHYKLGSLSRDRAELEKHYGKAVLDFTSSIEFGDDIDSYLYRGLAYDHLDFHKKAEADLAHYLRFNPSSTAALYKYGELQMHSKKYYLAIESFSKVLEQEPENKNAFFNRGMARYKLGQLTTACEDFEQARKLGHSEGYNQVKEHCK